MSDNPSDKNVKAGPLGVTYKDHGDGFVILLQPVFRVVATGKLRKEKGYDTELAYDVWMRLPMSVAEAEGIASKSDKPSKADPNKGIRPGEYDNDV